MLNPSTLDRLSHVLVAALQTGALLVISVSAFYLLKRRHQEMAALSLKLGLSLALAASLLQLVSGHHSAGTVAAHQPAKLAAFEGHFEAGAPAALHLFGWVDESAQKVRASLAIPGGVSWLLSGDPRAPVTGLNAFRPEDRPPVNPVFQSYHAMVAIGMLLIAISATGVLYWMRGRLAATRWLLWVLVFSVILPHAANQLGWFSAEVGRQPWIVYGLLRTRDGLSAVVSPGQTLFSLIMFSIVYLLLFALFIYLLDKKIRQGPVDEEAEAMEGGPRA